MIYKIRSKKLKDQETIYYAEEYIGSYVLPPKIYGNIVEKMQYVWNVFAQPNGRASVLITGMAGNSKTLACKVLCNIASEQLPVYLISETEVTAKMVEFISNLNNCVIFIDEFTKLVRWNTQELFLTLLSDSNKKRMFLLTDNRTSNINEYILNRPERIRYHFEFNTLSPSVIREFCSDHNVPEEFTNQILQLNITNKTFCFDHLNAIVAEAIRSNRYDIEWLTEILNIKALKTKESFVGVKTVNRDGIEILLDSSEIEVGSIVVVKAKDDAITPWIAEYESYLRGTFVEATNFKFANFIKDESRLNILKEKYKFYQELQQAYENVDTTYEQVDRWGNTMTKTLDASRHEFGVKINTSEDNIKEKDGDTYVYQDVTGNFKVYLKKLTRNM